MDFCPRTRRLDGLSSWNPEAGCTFVVEPGAWTDFRPGSRRLDGLSSWNPEAGWTFVLEPGGWMDLRPGTRMLVELLSKNLMVVWTFKGTFSYIFSTRSRLRRNPEMLLGFECRFWSPEAALDPEDLEVVLNPEVARDPEVPLDPEVVLNLEVSFGPGGRFEPGEVVLNPEVALIPEVVLNPEVALDPEAQRSFQDPETAWGPEGTVLCLPRKSLTCLEGAGVGVMTQVPGFEAFYVWRSRVLIAPCISQDGFRGRSRSFSQQEPGGRWNNLCTQVNQSCSFSVGYPWAGHRSSNPSFTGDMLPRSEVGILDLGFALQ
ncbi:hypothetical protein F2Q69_00005987 [Brassica cretica]|uniref:Uncharacterized protein n=1 Tax=Brassica cretica TaxID=69181 RepID=A0A8S9NLN1_BRACR|nr:hypothetical protein F2Q69_00005987 [Brassica cretica]